MPFGHLWKAPSFTIVSTARRNAVLVLSNSLGTDLPLGRAIPAFTQRFRVLRYDSYGHGASTFAGGGFSGLTGLARILSMLDHLGVTNISFCGLSVGGLVASGWACMPRSV